MLSLTVVNCQSAFIALEHPSIAEVSKGLQHRLWHAVYGDDCTDLCRAPTSRQASSRDHTDVSDRNQAEHAAIAKTLLAREFMISQSGYGFARMPEEQEVIIGKDDHCAMRLCELIKAARFGVLLHEHLHGPNRMCSYQLCGLPPLI